MIVEYMSSHDYLEEDDHKNGTVKLCAARREVAPDELYDGRVAMVVELEVTEHG
jgi:hypothetical protein